MNLRHPLIASLFSLSFIAPATANDGAYYASGNQIIPLQETDISVKKEVLTIKRIKDDKVQVTVDYTFHNPGAEKTILMGFEAGSPSGDVNGTPKNGKHPYIENFTVTFNEKNISHKVTIIVPDRDGKDADKVIYTLEELKKQQPLPEIDNTNVTDFFYVYHFPATFPKGDTRVIHTYDYAISGSVLTETEIEYLLTPALRWANKQIDDFTLIIDLGELQQYHISPTFFENTDQWTTQGRVKILMQDVKNEMSLKTSRVMTVWQQKGSVTFHAKNFKPNGELSLYSNRIIYLEGVIDSKTLKTSLQERPLFYEAKLKDEFTRKVLENIPYAQRGYAFKNKELKTYFEGQPWYMPDPEYKEAALTDYEKEWLKAVRELKIGE
jgi:YARHG domain